MPCICNVRIMSFAVQCWHTVLHEDFFFLAGKQITFCPSCLSVFFIYLNLKEEGSLETNPYLLWLNIFSTVNRAFTHYRCKMLYSRIFFSSISIHCFFTKCDSFWNYMKYRMYFDSHFSTSCHIISIPNWISKKVFWISNLMGYFEIGKFSW